MIVSTGPRPGNSRQNDGSRCTFGTTPPCSMNKPQAPHFWQPTRREFLYVGLLGTVGMTMSDLLRAESRTAAAIPLDTGAGKATSVINIYLPGGMSHQESFDPKITAPIEYRGPLEAIKTNV